MGCVFRQVRAFPAASTDNFKPPAISLTGYPFFLNFRALSSFSRYAFSRSSSLPFRLAMRRSSFMPAIKP
jgi:hypothetical protein